MAEEPKTEERRPAWREFVAEAGEAASELGLRNAFIVAGIGCLISSWALIGQHSKLGHKHRARQRARALRSLPERIVPSEPMQGLLHDRYMYGQSIVDPNASHAMYFQTLARAGPEGNHRLPDAWYTHASFGITASDPNGEEEGRGENRRRNAALRDEIHSLSPRPSRVLPWRFESQDGYAVDGTRESRVLARPRGGVAGDVAIQLF